VQLDARWYNPHSSRFQQPDYWNLRNTHLPTAIQHELMRFTGLNTSQLLNDPGQQLAYGYVSGNPIRYVDHNGLVVANVVGAVAGGLLDAGIQLGEIAFSNNKSLSDFDVTQVVINAAAGAVGAGIGSNITKLATKVGNAFATPTGAKVAAKVTDILSNALSGAVIGGTAGTVNDARLGKEVTKDSIVEHATLGAIVGATAVLTGPSGVTDSFGEYSLTPKLPKQELNSALVAQSTISNSNGLLAKIVDTKDCE
jgi:hypothetical protein